MRPGRPVAGFDSATAMLRALAAHLSGRDPAVAGAAPRWAEPAATALMGAANRLPESAKGRAYAYAGWAEALPHTRAGQVRSEDLARWVTGHYPDREHPVAFIGSANGALVHLAAALQAPWLPQTLLVPVRRPAGAAVHPDEPRRDLAVLRPAGRALVEANPELVLHHMHDPVQDRLMVEHMAYFRLKWRRLPAAYRAFLRRRLGPGGTLVVSECTVHWPTTSVADRYVFQHGAVGGATAEEFHRGSERVRAFLRRHGSHRDGWDAPEPDGHRPEAEWGFEPELLADVRRMAAEEGWNLVRLRYPHPQSLSPAVADLYRDAYARRGLPTGRLLVESFLLVEPSWALRSGSVPFWLVFPTEDAHRALTDYLDAAPEVAEIRLALFSHGVDSVGLAGAEAWRRVLERARKVGTFLGTDPDTFPRDFAVLARTHRELSRVRRTYPLPPPLAWPDVAKALAGRDDVELLS